MIRIEANKFKKSKLKIFYLIFKTLIFMKLN